MANIKTAISLQESLFDQAEQLARDLKVSRSRLFALALEEFMRQYQDRKLFEQIRQNNNGCARARSSSAAWWRVNGDQPGRRLLD